MAKSAKTLTTRDIAEELGIAPKALRVWLRQQDRGVGRGKEYRFTPKQAAKIIRQYQAA